MFIFDKNFNSKKMAITKQFLKTKPVCKVTFTIAEADAKKVSVVGEFNKWNAKLNPLKKLKNGNFKGTIDLETGKKYEFKYLVDGVHKNDEKADAYVYNDFAGTDNSVIEL